MSSDSLKVEHGNKFQTQIFIHVDNKACFFDMQCAGVERSAFLVERATTEGIADEGWNILDLSWPNHTFI